MILTAISAALMITGITAIIRIAFLIPEILFLTSAISVALLSCRPVIVNILPPVSPLPDAPGAPLPGAPGALLPDVPDVLLPGASAAPLPGVWGALPPDARW